MWFDFKSSFFKWEPWNRLDDVRLVQILQAFLSGSHAGCIQLLASIWWMDLLLLLVPMSSFAYSSVRVSSHHKDTMRQRDPRYEVVRQKEMTSTSLETSTMLFYANFKSNKQSILLLLAMPHNVHIIGLCLMVQPFLPKFNILLFF